MPQLEGLLRHVRVFGNGKPIREDAKEKRRRNKIESDLACQP